jgi:hypothetical protein
MYKSKNVVKERIENLKIIIEKNGIPWYLVFEVTFNIGSKRKDRTNGELKE